MARRSRRRRIAPRRTLLVSALFALVQLMSACANQADAEDPNLEPLLGATGRSASLVVAASDASERQQEQADYVCTGSNDQILIQAALDRLPDGGGKVLLTEGTFYLGASVVIDRNDLRIDGMGSGATNIIAHGDYPAIWFDGSSQNVINRGGLRDLTIRGGGPDLESAHGVELVYANRTVVENVVLYSTRHGLHIKDAWQVFVQNVSAHGQGADQNYIGLFGAASDHDNAIVANHFQTQNTISHGIRLISFSGSKFSSCEVGDAGGKGWYIGAPAGNQYGVFLHVVNSLADRTVEESWFIDGRGALADSVGDMQFANIWAGSGSEGLHVVNGDNITFSNILFRSFQRDAIVIEDSHRVDIHGGTVSDWGLSRSGRYSGVVLADSSKSMISGLQLASQYADTSVREIGRSKWNRIVNNDTADGGEIVSNLGMSSISGNAGFITASSGTAMIQNSNYVTINHGLSYTPLLGDISATPTNNLGGANRYWIGNVTETTFQISIDVYTEVAATFAWNARRS